MPHTDQKVPVTTRTAKTPKAPKAKGKRKAPTLLQLLFQKGVKGRKLMNENQKKQLRAIGIDID